MLIFVKICMLILALVYGAMALNHFATGTFNQGTHILLLGILLILFSFNHALTQQKKDDNNKFRFDSTSYSLLGIGLVVAITAIVMFDIII